MFFDKIVELMLIIYTPTVYKNIIVQINIMIIILTGSPGTGKDTVAERLVKKGFRWISINDLINKKKLWTSKEKGPKGAKIVDMKKLEKELKNIIKEAKKNPEEKLVIDGHLMCEFKLSVDVCIVLRTDPRELEKRLTRREYPKKKINENIEAELIDYCTQLAEKNLTCPVYELDTTKSNPKKTVEEIELIVKGKGKRFKAGSVDWSKLI